ncbi:MAG: penicillin-binding protein 2 [Actinomycetota bacterium]|nr:penicillin-binding protein 2 [Actinomycetota bacterium]
MQGRIRILAVFMFSLFLILFLQLNHVQVLQANELNHHKGNYRTITNTLSQDRGTIYTSDGQVIAETVPSNDVYKYQRYYPNGPLYAQVSGFDSINYGLDGLELEYNSYLQSRKLPPKTFGDLVTPKYGVDNVITTINSNLQKVAQSALSKYQGSVVAIDPKTGDILAMYSNPSFDPNLLASISATVEQKAFDANNYGPTQPGLARTYRRSYPPGSTFKIVTSSAVYDHMPSLATKFYPVVSSIPLPDTVNRLHNYANELCGGTIAPMLAVSCDSGFGQIGLDLGANNLASEAQSFGFNQTPPIDLPLPAKSTFPSASFFSNQLPTLAYSAIGQGNVSATPLQMALVGAAIANNGVIMAPHLMSYITNSQNAVVKRYQDHPWLQATSAATAQMVSNLMVGVVKNGTAQGIAIPGLKIAAKTGTAQLSLSASNQSSPNGNDNWMVAFAPAGNAKIAIAVVVPAQAGMATDSTGAAYAGPVVKAILNAYFNANKAIGG